MNLVSPGLYQSPTGFYVRPWIRGRRTWRKLKAVKLRPALVEAAQTDFSAPSGSFADLAALYLKHHCPNRRLEPRGDQFTKSENARCTRLISFFGRLDAASIRLADLPRYHQWRKRHSRTGGDRAVDKDLCTLSNVLNFGVAMGQLEINYVARGRPRYRQENDIRHSRAVAPASADVIHQLGEYFLETLRSEVFCWQALFAQFTGCRTSELLRLRLDAANEDQPGHVADDHLWLGRRSKGGVNPYSVIGPDFAAMLRAFRHWHAARFPKNPYYFPSPFGKCPVDLGAFGHALTRACRVLDLPHITPHGFRSFYVTKRRSDGASDPQIAGEIGDKTVSLMQTTYGSRPPNWRGGNPMTWLPVDRLPCWQSWQVDYGVDYAPKAKTGNRRQPLGAVVAGGGIEPPTQGFSGISSPVRDNPPATLTNVCRDSPTTTLRHTAPESQPTGLPTGL